MSTPRDYSAFDKLNLERKPVGVKFTALKPEGIKHIPEKRVMCEMFYEAQEGDPFYVQEDDFLCVEPVMLGMRDPETALVSGAAGGGAGLFKEPRANRKLYQYVPRMPKNSVKYVSFASIDKLTFDPDVVIITANVKQARSILRSEGYTTGDGWSCHGTPVMACSRLYVYPVVTGKMNFTITGLSLGMEAINMQIPEGLFVISIPWNLMPTVLENLQDPNLYRSWRSSGREEHFKKFEDRLSQLRKELPG